MNYKFAYIIILLNICIFHVDKKPIKYKVKDEIRFGKSRNHR